ncbi:peptidoglycan-binding protein [Loktanella sp. TSTF-M6]|uniref:Peptidoglycan-binding protein n=1 Tax=Loktanella gaetbuli TaxID=2881335 RepID=A0ABS8BRN7_9RHOB|nr:peptidoglycan-binding domain-containing protein [Loktanella gaetbuli]MCB5198292.1 peptidoglycan-binding protein [Loktanella gaetbuli]
MLLRSLALITALAPLTAMAADSENRFAVDGIGVGRCSVLVAANDAGDTALVAGFGSWASGYLTATNALAPGTFDMTPWQSESLILAQVGTYCRQNPDVPFFEALRRLIRQLDAVKLTEASEPLTLTADEESIQVYTAVAQGVRDALTALDYDVADGDAGLTDAIAAFQTDNALDPTGLPDQRTLLRLFNR